MSTRSLTMVYKNGEYKLAQHGKFDGDAEFMGSNILEFLKETDICKLKEAFDDVSFYTEEELDNIYKQMYSDIGPNVDIAEIRELEETYGGGVTFYRPKSSKRSRKQDDNCRREKPLGLSDMGGAILERIINKECNKFKNSIDFAAESTLCEWGYVIDLDKNTFEVYIGFNEEKLTPDDRFYWLEEKAKGFSHPIKLAKEYDLNNLPTYDDFVDELMNKYEEIVDALEF